MAIYYVANAGSDGAAGTSTGTAWQTISKVNSTATTGDTVNFNRGDIWREELTIPASSITIDAYGSGALPIISGGNLVTSWTDNSVGVYDFQDDFSSGAFGNWTTESDTGNDLTPSGGAAVLAHNDGSDHYLEKTGLSFTSTVTTQMAMTFSSDFNYQGGGGYFMQVRVSGNWVAGFETVASVTVGSPGTVQIGMFRNQPTFAEIGSRFTVNRGTTYTWKIVITGIGSSSSGAITWYLDNVQQGTSTGLNFSATVTSVVGARIGFYSKFGTPSTTAGTITFDDFWEDADGSPTGGVANTWKATVTTQPYVVMFNDTVGTKETSVANCNATYDWYWASNILYVYSTSSPSSAYTAPGISAGARSTSIVCTGKSSLSVANLQLQNGNDFGLWYLGDGTQRSGGTFSTLTVKNVGQSCIGIGNFSGVLCPKNITIQNCTLSGWSRKDVRDIDSGGANYPAISVQPGDTGDGTTGDNLQVLSNTFTGDFTKADPENSTGYDGISISAGDNWIVDGNTLTQCGHSITIRGSGTGFRAKSGIIRYNVITNSLDDVIWFDGYSQTATIHHNVLNCGTSSDQAIDTSGGTINIYNNVVANVRHAVVIFHTATPLVTFKNNICYNWGVAGTADTACFFSQNDGFNNTPGSSVFDYNVFYSSDGRDIANFPTGGSKNFAAWVSGGQDTHSYNSDPLFTDAGNADFTITATSPAKDHGVVISGISDSYLGTAPDIGYAEFSGAFVSRLLLKAFPSTRVVT